MDTFEIHYITNKGVSKRTTITAMTRQDCEQKIAGQNGTIITITMAQDKKNNKKRYSFPCMLEFTSLVSLLLDSSLTIKDALDIVASIARRSDVKNIARQISLEIGKGNNFNHSLQKTMTGLPAVYTGLVAIGERTGDLPRAYKRLDSYLESRKKIRDKLSSALAYPVIVLSVACIGIMSLTLFAVPKLIAVFSQLGSSAALQIETSLNTARRGAIILGVVFMALCAFFLAVNYCKKKNPLFAEKADLLALKLPFFGSLLESAEFFDFCFAMEALSIGAVPLDDALEQTAVTVENRALRKSINAVRNRVRNGVSLSLAVINEDLFPPFVKQWLAIGDRTGQTAVVFGKMRSFYQTQSEKQVNLILNIIEPGMSVIIGILVLVIVFVFIMPIFSTYGSLL